MAKCAFVPLGNNTGWGTVVSPTGKLQPFPSSLTGRIRDMQMQMPTPQYDKNVAFLTVNDLVYANLLLNGGTP